MLHRHIKSELESESNLENRISKTPVRIPWRPDLAEVDNAPDLTEHDQASVNAGLPIGPSVRVHTLVHGIYTMKKLNKHSYPIGKKRMQQVGIIIFALVMGTLGFQVPVKSGHQLITQIHHLWLTFSITPNINSHLVANTKLCAMIQQEHVKISSVLRCSHEVLPHTVLLNVQERDREAYAQDHFFSVITNSIGLAIQYIWQGRWTKLVSYCHTDCAPH